MKPYFADDTVTLYAGDCLDVLPTLPDASVDAVVCDPPYALPGGFMGEPWDAYDGREDAAFAYWLAGLIDGEGHFAIKAHTRGTHAPAFALKMRADELGTLEKIRRTLGIGTITREDRDPNPTAKWTVQDKAGCQRLVDLLDKYPLRAKKRMDYDIWREAVCEWSGRPRGNRWAGPADNTRMAALRQRLMDGRRYVDPPWSGHEFQDWCRLWAAECLRVLKPGGHLLAFGGTRTYHRLVCAIEDAGFEIRDSIHWIYGSGFPKSLDVSKAIDKAAGAKRESVGTIDYPGREGWTNATGARSAEVYGVIKETRLAKEITAPATDDARRWSGWGSALKPAHEPIVCARKPLSGTVAATVLEHGTGALNIDGCRVDHNGNIEKHQTPSKSGLGKNGVFGDSTREQGANSPTRYHDTGRWPTNVVLTHSAACADECAPDCPVAEMDRQSEGKRASKPSKTGSAGKNGGTVYGGGKGIPKNGYVPISRADEGGASRFFPVFRYEAKAPASERPRGDDGTAHATVKPLALMRWLVRLVTPPGGTVLDPFLGSGTTAEACVIEGFRCVGIERNETHLPLIKARLSKPIQPALGFEDAS